MEKNNPYMIDGIEGLGYGADYAPEQHDTGTVRWHLDQAKEAGLNFLSVGIFSWPLIEKSEGRFDFTSTDFIMNELLRRGIRADLATPTASPPMWLMHEYPEVLIVDMNGNKYYGGSRNTYCPNNADYQRLSRRLAEKIVKRYAGHPALGMWHINNEMSQTVFACYCDQCAEAFRVWLKKKYKSLDELNRAWGTAFWGHQVYDWNHIKTPKRTAQFKNPGVDTDYMRFINDSYMDLYFAESEIVRKYSGKPITTNFLDEFKTLDYHRWARLANLDYASITCFPNPADTTYAVKAAFTYDFIYGLKDKPWMLMEQTPNCVSWRNANKLKEPGLVDLWSMQNLAHGADALAYFQLAASFKGPESTHGAIIAHSGVENRVYREVKATGLSLQNLGEIRGTRKVHSKVAILMDRESWWSLELPSRPNPNNTIKYLDVIRYYYASLFSMNLGIDVIACDRDLGVYDLVVAPLLFMLKNETARKITDYVREGGTFVTTMGSCHVDENCGVHEGGAPGPLKEVLGIASIPESDGLEEDILIRGMENSPLGREKAFHAGYWADMVEVSTAEILAAYDQNWYRGRPCILKNRFGKGQAWYFSIHPESSCIDTIFESIAREKKISARLQDIPKEVEVTERRSETHGYLFILNHGAQAARVALESAGKYFELRTRRPIDQAHIEIASKGSAVLKYELTGG